MNESAHGRMKLPLTAGCKFCHIERSSEADSCSFISLLRVRTITGPRESAVLAMMEGSLLLQTLEQEHKVANEPEALRGKTSSGFCEGVDCPSSNH